MRRTNCYSYFFLLALFGYLSMYLLSNYYQVSRVDHLGNRSIKIISKQGMCSEKSDLRGPNQRIISYSVYGNLGDPYIIQRYLEPTIDNINNIHHLYPGWVVRVYHNFTDVDPVELENFFQVNDQVDLCDATHIIKHLNLGNIFAKTWRWLPLLDDLVDVMMSRDSDSYINDRELAAVEEWMDSKEHTFHIMKDHPTHCIEILGGMWGVKLYRNRTALRIAAKDMLNGTGHSHDYDYDQQLLKDFIWPIAKLDSTTHDSYCCSNHTNSTRPFPTKRKWKEYVGRIGRPTLNMHHGNDYLECPVECRGSPDWIYC